MERMLIIFNLQGIFATWKLTSFWCLKLIKSFALLLFHCYIRHFVFEHLIFVDSVRQKSNLSRDIRRDQKICFAPSLHRNSKILQTIEMAE
jgi:hypothetical protein